MVHVIKVYLEDSGIGNPQIRRLAVSSDVVNKFDLLHEKISDLFPTIGQAFEVAWKDPEGDLVQMSSDAELAQALANAEDGLIKLYVIANKISEKQDDEAPRASYHPQTICDGCNVHICGHRYKCLQCSDFDLCSACNAANKHPDHDMIKLVRPNYVPREWVFPGARAMWRSMFGHCRRGFHQHNQPKKDNNENSSPKQEKSSPSEKWQEAFANLEKGNFVPTKLFYENVQKWQEAFANLENGNFVPTELFHENIQKFLKFAGVEVKIEKCPFDKRNSENKETKTETPKAETSKAETPKAETPKDEAQPKFEKTIPEKAKQSCHRNTDDDGIRVRAEPEKEDCCMNSELAGGVAGFEFGVFGARPKENMEPSALKVECNFTEIQQKEKTHESDVILLESSNGVDGWTLLNKEETGKKEPPAPEHLPENDTVPKASNPEGSNTPSNPEDVTTKFVEKESVPNDPEVENALTKMCAMGFTNEGGWLERLLVAKKGNINDALDSLYPNTLRH